MRSSLLLLALLGPLAARPAAAQSANADTLRPAAPAPAAAGPLGGFDAERRRLDRRGLLVLGSWATGNLLVSGIATGQTDGSAHYFHQMNLGWGAVNLALAGAGILAARRAARAPGGPLADRPSALRAQLRTENLYLFNAGLDVAYLATGAYFLEKSRNPATDNPNRWRGYGQSLLLQGGFLLLFDGFQFATHHRHGQALYPLLSRVRLGPGGLAVVLPLGQNQLKIKN